MKKDITAKIYKNVFGVEENHENVNSFLRAIILEFSEKTVIVENDNFGTNRKYADFTKGKEKAGLDPMQIVFSGVDVERIFHTKYIGKDNKVHTF